MADSDRQREIQTQEEPLHPYRLIAAALRYDPGQESAPRVAATGRGHVAERIIELARAHGVPLREDRVLAEALAQLDLNQIIPPDMYKAVAEVLAFVYRLDTQRSHERRAGLGPTE